MKSNYRKIRDFIRLVDERNTDLIVDTLLGLTINKEFIPSVANTVGTDMAKYKVIRKDQFACSLMQVRRDGKIPVAIMKNYEEAIISQAYPVFEVIDPDILLPVYLMMWMSRSEFDREACFYAVGGVRGSLEWEDFCNMQLPVPSIEKQRAIVKEYNTVVNRIKLNEEINRKLEETAQAVYKRWFVDFEFPCLPTDYRPSGQVNLSDMNRVCTYKRVGGVPDPDGKSWFVYILLCEDDSFYKGMTNDLYRRFYDHFTGKGAEWTKVHKPVKIIHWEQFETQKEAAKREKELKSGFGRTWIKREYKKLLNDGGSPAPKTRLRQAGKMAWNDELGKKVPEGWEVGKLSDITKIIMGQSPNGDSYNNKGDGIALINGPVEFGDYFAKKTKWTTSPSKLSAPNDLIICVRGSTTGRYVKSDDEYCLGRGVCIFRAKKYQNFVDYTYKSNINNLLSFTTGSTFPNWDRETLSNYPITLPTPKVMEYYEDTCGHIINYVETKHREIDQLKNSLTLLLSTISITGI